MGHRPLRCSGGVLVPVFVLIPFQGGVHMPKTMLGFDIGACEQKITQ